MIRYQLFPRSCALCDQINAVVEIFLKNDNKINSDLVPLKSNEVLKILEPDLKSTGFSVEGSKATIDKIKVPVLFGLNSQIEKSFDADALSEDGRIVIEVEAGRAFANNQFLKDIFQACMMQSVDYLILAVKNNYRGHDDFKAIHTYLETLYINGRLVLPLKGIVLIGY